MSDAYTFDLTVSPIQMFEWDDDDGAWERENLSLNESLTATPDGELVTLIKTYATYKEIGEFIKSPNYGTDSSYVESREYYTDLAGNLLPGEPEDQDEGEDDGVDDDDRDGDGSDDDSLDGGDGDDIEHGGAGDDNIDGGLGDDDLYGDAGDDDLNGQAGNDHLAGGLGFDALFGGSENDFLEGNEGDDDINGEDGFDSLNGGAGDDDLDGGSSADSLNGNAGDDHLDGGTGHDSLSGGDGNDELYAGAGNDTVNGGLGDDLIIGGDGAGNDRYIGDQGNDTVKYTSATAGIRVNLAAGTAGSISADAGIGMDVLLAIENVIGGNFNDLLTGNMLSNKLSGEGGIDTIVGGLGKDILSGGSGDDVFKYNSVGEAGIGSSRDSITDFSPGDKIDLTAIDAKYRFTRNDSFTFLASAPTSALSANGALWFSGGILYGSTDSDIAAEFEIKLDGVASLSGSDILL